MLSWENCVWAGGSQGCWNPSQGLDSLVTRCIYSMDTWIRTRQNRVAPPSCFSEQHLVDTMDYFWHLILFSWLWVAKTIAARSSLVVKPSAIHFYRATRTLIVFPVISCLTLEHFVIKAFLWFSLFFHAVAYSCGTKTYFSFCRAESGLQGKRATAGSCLWGHPSTHLVSDQGTVWNEVFAMVPVDSLSRGLTFAQL